MIELNRKLYMDEATGEKRGSFDDVRAMVLEVVRDVVGEVVRDVIQTP